MDSYEAGYCGDFCSKCPNHQVKCRGCIAANYMDCFFVKCCLTKNIDIAVSVRTSLAPSFKSSCQTTAPNVRKYAMWRICVSARSSAPRGDWNSNGASGNPVGSAPPEMHTLSHALSINIHSLQTILQEEFWVEGKMSDKKKQITIIKGGTLIDGTGTDPKKNQTIVIEGNQIAAVGKEADTPIPKKGKMTEIDASGKTIMPGLIDSHMHFMGLKTDKLLEEDIIRPQELALIKSAYDAFDLLDAGFTTVKDCGGFGIHLRRSMQEGTIRGPRILSAGYVLSQTAGHADAHYLPIEWVDARTTKKGMSLICDGVPECIKAARYALRQGADFIKICTSGGVMSQIDRPEHTQFTLEEVKAIVQEARHVGKFVTTHCQGTEAMKNSITAGVKTIDHAFYPDDEVIKMAKQRKDVIFVPTLSINWRIITEGEKAGYHTWAVAKGKEAWDKTIKNIAKLQRAGLTIASATDFIGSPLLKHGTNAMELELLIKHCGFTPMDAIVAATQNGAKACGLEKETGTIETGKLADIIIIDGNPLKNIRTLQDKNKIKMVMKEGKIEINRGIQTPD